MIGIIILTYNNWEETKRCIESIVNFPPEEDYHIYCIDNGSSVRSPFDFEKQYGKQILTLICTEKNLGYAAGNNVGIKEALQDGCEWLVISNNDIVFCENAISEMALYLKNHPQVGIVGPRVIRRDGKTQKGCMCIKTGMKEKYLLRTRFHIFFPKYNKIYWGMNHDYDHDLFQVHAVSGCCFMISAKCAQEVTPLDEGTFLYEEEFILGIVMENAGWKTMYVPTCTVLHLHGASTCYVKAFAYTCNVRSEIYYCRKYLKASRIAIFGLYLYRLSIYMLHCLKSNDYRKSIRCFMRDTVNYLWNI